MPKNKSLTILFYLFAILLFTNCCTTKNEFKDEKTNKAVNLEKDNAPIPLAPGTAEVSCAITEIIKINDRSTYKIKVHEVNRYGPATKPIAVGSEINLETNDNYMEKLNNFFSNKNEVTLTIEILRGGIGQELFNSWKLVKINQ